MSTIISHRKQFVFIHINKAGGTSISALLGEYEENRGLKRIYRAIERRYLPRRYRAFSFLGQDFVGNHASALMVRDTIGAERFAQYCKFGIVRNPWDREVSRYFFARKTPTHQLHSMANRYDFREFIKLRSEDAESKGVRGYQFKKISDADGNLIVDHVVHLENLEAEILPVFEQIGVPPPAQIATLNRSHHKPYQEYYDDETIELVGQFSREDVERLGYRFDNKTA